MANPPLSAFKKKKKRQIPKKRRLPAKDLKRLSSASQHYWNEFDDGSEGEHDEPFTIFIDANSKSGFPGTEIVSSLSDSLSANSRAAWGKLKSYWNYQEKDYAGQEERRPLISGSNTPSSPIIEDSSDSDETFANPQQPGYAIVVSNERRTLRTTREGMLFRCTLGSFIASLIFVLVAAILLSTGRRKAAAEVDVGVVICVAASVVSAIMGVGCTISRRARLNWVYKTTVGLVVALAILANAGVLVGLGHMQVLD